MSPMKWVIAHDDTCPLSDNGWRAFWEKWDAITLVGRSAPMGSTERVGTIASRLELLSGLVCTCKPVKFFSVEGDDEQEGSAQR